MNEQSITVQFIVKADTREEAVAQFMAFYAHAANPWLGEAQRYGIVAASVDRVMTEEEYRDSLYVDAITGKRTLIATERS